MIHIFLHIIITFIFAGNFETFFFFKKKKSLQPSGWDKKKKQKKRTGTARRTLETCQGSKKSTSGICFRFVEVFGKKQFSRKCATAFSFCL